MTTARLPTRGKQRVLQFASRANWRLFGSAAADGAVVYQIVELSNTQPPRVVMDVTAFMVTSLVDAGWIERTRGDRQTWEYRLTPAGIEAANGPASAAVTRTRIPY